MVCLDGPLVFLPFVFCGRLRLCVVRAFCGRKESAGDVPISSLVIHKRFQDDVVHDHRTDGGRSRTGHKGQLKSTTTKNAAEPVFSTIIKGRQRQFSSGGNALCCFSRGT